MAVRPQILGNVLEFVHQEDTFASFARVWLADESELRVLLHVGFKTVCFLGQQETYRREAELLLKGLTHAVRN